MISTRLLLYLRTLRHLKMKQAAYFVVRRLLPEEKSHFAEKPDLRMAMGLASKQKHAESYSFEKYELGMENIYREVLGA